MNNKFSDRTKRIIRMCWDLDAADTSRYNDFETLGSRAAFRYVCQWEFGDPSWASIIIEWLDQCGFEVKEKYE